MHAIEIEQILQNYITKQEQISTIKNIKHFRNIGRIFTTHIKIVIKTSVRNSTNWPGKRA